MVLATISKGYDQSCDNTEIEYKQQQFKSDHQSIIPRATTINTAIDYNTLEKEIAQREDEDNRGLHANVSMSQGSKCEALWRICLSEDSTKDNPLISPWKWSGTMKFIHLDWLKEWLNSKRSEKKGI